MATMAPPMLQSFEPLQMAQTAPMIPVTEPQRETLPALQSIAPVEKPPAVVSIKPPSDEFQQFVNSTDAIPEPPKPAKVPGRLKFMATLALLANRDFGPMMSLLQQERKADLQNKFFTVIPKANSLIRQGKIAEATKLIEQARAELSSADPELGAMMAPLQEKIFNQEKVQTSVKHMMASLELDYARLSPEKKEAKKEEHKAQINKLKLGLTISDPAMLKMHIDSVLNRTTSPDVANNAVIVTDAFGNITSVPNEQRPVRGDYPDWVMQTLSGETGAQPSELLNILRDPKHPQHKNISILAAALMERQAQATMTKGTLDPLTTLSQRLNMAREGYGGKQQNMALYTGGAFTEPFNEPSGAVKQDMMNLPEAARETAIRETGRMKEETLKASLNVPLQASPEGMQQFAILGGKASGDEFLMPRYDMSINEANASKGKYRVVSKQVEKDSREIGTAIANINNVVQMFEYAGNPEGTVERLVSGARRQLKAIFGTENPADVSVSLLAGVVKDSLETINGKLSLPNAEKGVANRLITGSFADANAAIEGLKPFLDVARNHIDVLMGESAASINKQLEGPRAIERRRSAVPTEDTLRKAAGLKPKGDSGIVSGTVTTPGAATGTGKVRRIGKAEIAEMTESTLKQVENLTGEWSPLDQFVNDKDDYKKADEKLHKATIKLLEAQGNTVMPDGIIMHDKEAK